MLLPPEACSFYPQLLKAFGYACLQHFAMIPYRFYPVFRKAFCRNPLKN